MNKKTKLIRLLALGILTSSCDGADMSRGEMWLQYGDMGEPWQLTLATVVIVLIGLVWYYRHGYRYFE